MSINKKIIVTAAIGLAFGVSSCKKYLNVNTNPNIAQAATMPTLLPAAMLYVGTAQGVDLEVDGSFFAQFWTQNPGASQYHNLDQYAPGQDGFSTPWTNLYAANENFYQLYKLADSLRNKNYMAISLILQAYTFQLITDGWGSAPFSQALKGQFADGHLVNPAYDSQRVVYNGLVSYLNTADSLIALGDPATPGADDLIYQGQMGQWLKFSNTLKLKIYLRESAINPTQAQANIVAFMATSPTFLGMGDDAFIGYGYNSANKNPLFAEEAGLGYTQNIVASSTCVDSMNSNSDPRLYVFYTPASALGSNVFVGNPQGQYNITPANGTISIASQYVAGNAQAAGSTNAPVNLLTSYESLFMQAEVAARGWVAGNDDSLFYQGIQASFNYYNTAFEATTGATGAANYANYIAAGGNWTIYPTGGSAATKVQYIITQKWFAMCGNQGFEAWTEWRRTGYPNFFIFSESSTIGNVFPKRFTYPTTESNVNSAFPGLVPLTTNVWWDVL